MSSLEEALARYMAMKNEVDDMRRRAMEQGGGLSQYAAPDAAGRFSSYGRLNPSSGTQWSNFDAFDTIGQQLKARGMTLPEYMSQNIEDRRPANIPNPFGWLRSEARK